MDGTNNGDAWSKSLARAQVEACDILGPTLLARPHELEGLSDDEIRDLPRSVYNTLDKRLELCCGMCGNPLHRCIHIEDVSKRPKSCSFA